jgi:hypothetical protein
MRPGGEVWFGGRYSSPTPPFQTVNAYFVSNGGVHTRIYGDGDPTLDGAVLKNPSEPVVNALGEIALTSQSVAPGTNYSVFYRGRPGQWRRVLGFADSVHGWSIRSIGGIKSQFQALDDFGNLAIWVELLDPSTNQLKEEILIDRPTSGLSVLLREGDAAPLGTVYGKPTNPGIFVKAFFEVPSLSSFGELMICTDLFNGAVFAGSGIVLLDLCFPPGPSSYCTAKLNSVGCTPSIRSSGIPSASAPGGFEVRASSVLNQKVGMLMYGMIGPAATPFQGGLLCIASPVRRALPRISDGALPPALDCSGTLRLDMNAFARGTLGGSPSAALSAPGTDVRCQWWGRDPGYPAGLNSQLTDGLAYRVTP